MRAFIIRPFGTQSNIDFDEVQKQSARSHERYSPAALDFSIVSSSSA